MVCSRCERVHPREPVPGAGRGPAVDRTRGESLHRTAQEIGIQGKLNFTCFAVKVFLMYLIFRYGNIK